MSYRIRVEHVSRYRYARVVHSSYNETRLTPLTTPWQLVLDSRVQVEPASTLNGYVDYWGSVVHAFDLQKPHEEMVITGRSVVETSLDDGAGSAGAAPGLDGRAGSVGWRELADEVSCDQYAEYLAPTNQVPVDDRLTEVAHELAAGSGPAEAAARAVGWVGEQLTYVPGTTGVHTSAVEAWDGGKGVCQDFAHLTLAVLRAMGIPGRYCSGYVHPRGDAAVGHTVKG
jgi:transglutaminase-like putative cysteine protease